MNEQVELELDRRAAELLTTAQEEQEKINEARAAIRRSVVGLVGHHVPVLLGGEVRRVYVSGASASAPDRFDAYILGTGQAFELPLSAIYLALQQLGQEAEAHGPEPTH